MASESRQLPKSNIGRRKALDAAAMKNIAMGVNSFLTIPTKNRLVAIQPVYKTKYEGLTLKKLDVVTATSQKDEFARFCEMTCSHFVQVFNMGIERRVFTKEQRTYYNIDVNDGTVPNMNTEEDLKLVAENLITGETNRIAAGGTPMAMPNLAELTLAYNNFNNDLMPQSTAVDAYDAALEDLDNQNDEADKVIKKVWDEVETFYNEEDPASQRENAREWGVKYVLTGSNKAISGRVKDVDTGATILDAEVYLENGNNTSTSTNEGYNLTTRLMGVQPIIAVHPLYEDFSHELTLVENENMTYDILMKKLP